MSLSTTLRMLLSRAPHFGFGGGWFFICKCEHRSCSRIFCSAHSNTKQICSHISPHAGLRECYIHDHNRGGCSHLVLQRFGYTPFPGSQGYPVCDLQHSSWGTCEYTADLLYGLVSCAGFFLSSVAFFSVCLKPGCCFHTYLLKNCQSCQSWTWFSSMFSGHRTQRLHDNGNRLSSVLPQPKAKRKSNQTTHNLLSKG